MSNLIVCRCQTCDKSIEFEDTHLGETSPCPHCGIDTLLYKPHEEKPQQIIHAQPAKLIVKPPRKIPWLIILIGGFAFLFGLGGGLVGISPDDNGVGSGTFIGGFFGGLLAFVIFAFALFIYFLPLVVAASKHKKNVTAIGLLNLLAGWTFVGWVISLVWAATED